MTHHININPPTSHHSKQSTSDCTQNGSTRSRSSLRLQAPAGSSPLSCSPSPPPRDSAPACGSPLRCRSPGSSSPCCSWACSGGRIGRRGGDPRPPHPHPLPKLIQASWTAPHPPPPLHPLRLRCRALQPDKRLETGDRGRSRAWRGSPIPYENTINFLGTHSRATFNST